MFQDYTQIVMDFVRHNHMWALPVVFVLAFGESLAFISLFLPAWAMLGYWFLLQILGGLPTLAAESGGVAFWAHAGGFVAGMVLIWLFRNPKLVARRTRLVSPYY